MDTEISFPTNFKSLLMKTQSPNQKRIPEIFKILQEKNEMFLKYNFRTLLPFPLSQNDCEYNVNIQWYNKNDISESTIDEEFLEKEIKQLKIKKKELEEKLKTSQRIKHLHRYNEIKVSLTQITKRMLVKLFLVNLRK